MQICDGLHNEGLILLSYFMPFLDIFHLNWAVEREAKCLVDAIPCINKKQIYVSGTEIKALS